MEIRSFLAFELPPEIRKTVSRVAGELRRSPLTAKWVRVDNIHLTMVFMGTITTDDIPSMGDAIQKACSRYGPFEISLKGVGVFPGRKNPRVIWVGLDGTLKRMAFFRDALQKRLEPFGIRQEKRRFKPHLTLGRFRKHIRSDSSLDEVLDRYKEMRTPAGVLNSLILFKSDLKPTGAEYTRLQSWIVTGRK